MKYFIISIYLTFGLGLNANSQQIERSSAPDPGPAPEINIGEYHSFTLKNGLQVFVVENHKSPKISYSLIIDTDPIYEGEHAGYVSVAGNVMGTATTTRSKQEIDSEVDYIGGSLSIGANSAYASSLKKHNYKMLELFSDVVINAKFKEEELDKAKRQAISSLKSAKNDPGSLSGMLENVVLYGKAHPYGEMITENSLGAINLNMVEKYYQTYYKPNISYMAIVGDITLKEAKKQMEKYFGSWQKGDVPSHTYKNVTVPDTRTVVVYDRPQAVQSVLKVTHPVDLQPGDEDRIKSRVMNTILGGGTYRLFYNLRETHGWTYGAYSSLNSDKVVGSFTAYTEVANAVTDSSTSEIIYEMKRLQEEKVPEDELQRVKNYITGNFALALEKPETVASFALNIARYDLDESYYRDYLKNVSAVTAEDVQQMANKYLKPGQCYVFVVGKADEVAEGLKKFSSNAIRYIDEDGNYMEK